MKIIYPIPAEKISSYVQSMLVIEGRASRGPFVMPLFANGTPVILFSTEPMCMGDTRQHLILFGQTIIPGELTIEQDFTMVAWFLKPYALNSLFNIPAGEITDHPLGWDALPGKTELAEKLLNTSGCQDIIQSMEDFLSEKIRAIRTEDKRLHYAAEKIGRVQNIKVLTELQRELYLTEKTFQRLFERHIGVSPNLFRRVSQFNNAFRQINAGRFRDLSSVAYQHGYADQSHFIRAFKEFTHLTPSAYLHARVLPG